METSSQTKNIIFYFGKQLLMLLTFLLGMGFHINAQQTIEVSGLLPQNTTWSSENTYIVTDNVRVIFGVQLTIEAGTTVKFNQGRGLNIEGGRIHIAGNEQDSVLFIPNYSGTEHWNWAGITISSVTQPGNAVINYAHLTKAVLGIKSVATENLVITNSTISNNLFIGISLTNSSFATIEGNVITDNFLGLEIYAADPGNFSKENLIRRNHFSNVTTNINVHNNNQGACPFNYIEDNIIKSGIHGIWIFNSGDGHGHAHLKRNIIFNNGNENDGYGIYVAMDSVSVINNILWNNTIGVGVTNSVDPIISNNQFYENRNALRVREKVENPTIQRNTITGNKAGLIRVDSEFPLEITNNNIFNNIRESAWVVHNSDASLQMTNNFWNTNDEEQIIAWLNPSGQNESTDIFFEPFSEDAFVNAPVSPPFNFSGQIIKNRLHLTWEQNPEDDLLGYRIHYGEFLENYTFSNQTEMISDTSFVTDIPVADNIAISAFDNSSGVPGSQVVGHQSPFAFLELIPFAGRDTTVCSSLQAFVITGSTIPPGYDNWEWTTEGSGTFSNPNNLMVTYFIDEQDKLSDEITLTLTASREEKEEFHSFRLIFEQAPEVFAGEDVYLSDKEVYETTQATATQTNDLLWTTTGDGSFDDETSLLTTYTPGNTDISNGVVQLILTAQGEFCNAVDDTVNLYFQPTFFIQGSVWTGDIKTEGNPVIAVHLNHENDLIPDRVLTRTNENGEFRLDGLFSGEYVIFALPDTAEAKDYLPTYHASETKWQNAYVHNIEGNVYDVDIYLKEIPFTLPEGTGNISGFFDFPVVKSIQLSTYCVPWFDNEAQMCNGGLSNVTLFLYSRSRQVIYQHTLSDESGNFSFNNLPYGDYIIEAEIAGFQSTLSELITLSPQQNEVKDISMFIDQSSLKINIINPPATVWNPEAELFPNPATDKINIVSDLFSDSDQYYWKIKDVMGKTYLTGESIPYRKEQSISVNILPQGVYFLHYKNAAGKNEQRFKFIKQ